MDKIALYWELLSHVTRITNIGITAVLFCRFARPFLSSRKQGIFVGVSYFAAMLVVYFVPYEMDSMVAYAGGTSAAFLVMYVIDRRNIEQKLFLAVVMYLLNWISYSITALPRNFAFQWVYTFPRVASDPMLLLGCYALIEGCYMILHFLLLAFLISTINRVYVCKKEKMNWRELGLMLATPFSVLLGYGIFNFISNTYFLDTGSYIQNVHAEFEWIQTLYQVISYLAILAAIAFYQSIQKDHRREKENAVLSGQIESMKAHIREVEALYRDVRGLRHDMGNHVMVLKSLVQKNEAQEAARYLSALEKQLDDVGMEVKSGNPVTDVILTEKKKEAEQKGIAFSCDFHYPDGTKINAFDVSVILNNAASNAIEAAEKCDAPYVHIKSYRKKNAYMIEVRNRFAGELTLDEESGLPESTKTGAEHGFGLANIRKVAQSYFGDIEIGQEGDEFRLSILLMVPIFSDNPSAP